MADIKKIIKDLQDGFGTSEEGKGKILSLLKGIVFSDDDLAKEYLKKLDKATTDISKEILGDKESKKEAFRMKSGFYKFQTDDEAVDFIYSNDYSERDKRKGQEAIDKAGIAQIDGDIIIVDEYDLLDDDYTGLNKIRREKMEEVKTKVDGEKVFNIQYNIGKAKYVVNFHDGEQTYKDGSPFYDMRIFKNKKDLENFEQDLYRSGYIQESTMKLKKGQNILDEQGREWTTEGNEVVRGGMALREDIDIGTIIYSYIDNLIYIYLPGEDENFKSRKKNSNLSSKDFFEFIDSLRNNEIVNMGSNSKMEQVDVKGSGVDKLWEFMNQNILELDRI
jgi:hypothetical protein